MGTILRSEHPEQLDESSRDRSFEATEASEATIEFRSIIAREGSELAELLRGRGWIVRSGWRGQSDDGQSVWNLRFETPDTTEPPNYDVPA